MTIDPRTFAYAFVTLATVAILLASSAFVFRECVTSPSTSAAALEALVAPRCLEFVAVIACGGMTVVLRTNASHRSADTDVSRQQ